MDLNAAPRLAAPGAGLPKPELYLGRLMFAFKRWTGTRSAFDAEFQAERQRIRNLVDQCDSDSACIPVLIARCRGMEDSSRYWSVWMTLDHLRIVNQSFIGIIKALSQGTVPKSKASTANVKPSPGVTAAVLAQYEEVCDKLVATVGAVPNLKTPARYAHPWFGAMNAAGWHALAGGHMRIHRTQIERILDGLRANAARRSSARTPTGV